MSVVHGLIVVAAAPCWGCGLVSRNFPKMQNPAPVVRARAIARRDSRLNTREMPELIGRLEDADPVVRLAAHEELRRRTGRDFGFVPWASREERAAAVGRWRSWLTEQSEPAGTGRATGLPPSSAAMPRGTITEDP
ncbi:MAG: hypothetical protein ACLQGP_31285 [Isosphaeraceae bacterium]